MLVFYERSNHTDTYAKGSNENNRTTIVEDIFVKILDFRELEILKFRLNLCRQTEPGFIEVNYMFHIAFIIVIGLWESRLRM